MAKSPTNIAASVRQRLLNLARSEGRDFQTLLVAFGLERLIFRLSKSPHRDKFVLKGGMLVTLWTTDPGRFTRDIDFLAFGETGDAALTTIFAEILTLDAGDGLEFSIDTAIKARLGEHKARQFDILTSIPGIGPVTAATMLIECPELGALDRKQVASLAGLAPMTQQSGQWRGKAFIQGGRKFLRDALYMPALGATRFNPDMKARYQAMGETGKPAKVALTAIMRKIIELAIALIRDDRKWSQRVA